MALKIAGNTVVDDNLKAYVDGVDLSAISASIADTAVDVFVYDTRKDSDGGAWRKRTQHTSWYNETLNTSTRGSRKEFPAVAVIVAESNQVTIYDGDDPDLPMWMEASFASYQAVTSTNTSIAMLNGHMTIGGGINGLGFINFIKDQGTFIWAGGYKYVSTNIANRNVAQSGWGATVSSATIVNSTVNDVAMTVLPNAPIDDATGLPIPTIAVATNGGVSVIKDDGNVWDITYTGQNGSKSFKVAIGSDYVDSMMGYSNLAPYTVYRHPIPSSDLTVDTTTRLTSKTGTPTLLAANINSATDLDAMVDARFLGGNYGLSILTPDVDNQSSQMVNYISSSYNTGWMNGDIKLATLSDTDDTDVTGSELVTNGTFDTDTSGWTAVGTGSTFVWDAGRVKITTTTNYSGIYQPITVEVGKRYILSATVDLDTDASVRLAVEKTLDGPLEATQTNITADGEYTYEWVATVSNPNIRLDCDVSVGISYFDNISVRLAEEDRSVNGNGLQVFGTVQKNPVATGADLVAYSGMSSNEHLYQPHNSDLDFGTGDFCFMGWQKWNNANDYGAMFHLNNSSNVTSTTSGPAVYSGGNQLTIRIGANEVALQTTKPAGVWQYVCFVRRNGTVTAYIDGVEITSFANTFDVSSAPSGLYIGSYYYNGGTVANAGLNLALFRVSATAPTAEQIKRIYEDEKVLFQEGAQATLYGSSDAVTALAYDDTTELLHVGTSAGRSDFSGLRRVSNTTDAVGTAISASNGMIVEE